MVVSFSAGLTRASAPIALMISTTVQFLALRSIDALLSYIVSVVLCVADCTPNCKSVGPDVYVYSIELACVKLCLLDHKTRARALLLILFSSPRMY